MLQLILSTAEKKKKKKKIGCNGKFCYIGFTITKSFFKARYKIREREFPSGPVVRTAEGTDSRSAWGTKILKVVKQWPKK